MTEESPAAPHPEAGGFAFHELLDVRAIAQERGRGKLELTVQERHLRSLGIVHGGVMASLLDAAMGMAVGSLAPRDHYVVTVQLNVNFIRPGWPGETLVATAEVVHAGRQTAVARGEIRTETDALVAAGTATFLFLPHSDRTRGRIERAGPA